MNGFTKSQQVIAKQQAEKYIKKADIDFIDLSAENLPQVNRFIQQVFRDWRSGNISDLVTAEIGDILEGEPIVHLVEESIYPLPDIAYYLENDDYAVINKWKKAKD